MGKVFASRILIWCSSLKEISLEIKLVLGGSSFSFRITLLGEDLFLIVTVVPTNLFLPSWGQQCLGGIEG